MKSQRMCAVCRQVGNKEDFVRIVKQNGVVSLDVTGKANGRGVYICKKSECMVRARKARAVERSLSCQVDDVIYSRLEALAENDK